MLKENEYITVYNESSGNVYAKTSMNPNGELFPCMEDGQLRETPITVGDARYINTNSSFFRNGILRFNPSQEEEISKLIGLKIDSRNYMNNEEIKDIILNPTTDKLQKIIDITSSLTMEKIKNKFIELYNSDDYYIAEDVIKVIDARYYELYNNHLNSQLKIKKKKNVIAEEEKEIKTKSKNK